MTPEYHLACAGVPVPKKAPPVGAAFWPKPESFAAVADAIEVKPRTLTELLDAAIARCPEPETLALLVSARSLI